MTKKEKALIEALFKDIDVFVSGHIGYFSVDTLEFYAETEPELYRSAIYAFCQQMRDYYTLKAAVRVYKKKLMGASNG
jgi:hypothetical protein